MPEPYAVRYDKGKKVGSYKTKKDYEAGKLSSFGRTNRRLKSNGGF
ncbi:MAG: hypothetical protein ACTTJM_00210 [Bergeyella cardium]